jgi:hypothetical protein
MEREGERPRSPRSEAEGETMRGEPIPTIAYEEEDAHDELDDD